MYRPIPTSLSSCALPPILATHALANARYFFHSASILEHHFAVVYRTVTARPVMVLWHHLPLARLPLRLVYLLSADLALVHLRFR